MASSMLDAVLFHTTNKFSSFDEAYLEWGCEITGVCFNSRVDKCECNTVILYSHSQSQPKCGMSPNDLTSEITSIKDISRTVP